MSANLLALKIATPYARAFFDFSVEKNIIISYRLVWSVVVLLTTENILFIL